MEGAIKKLFLRHLIGITVNRAAKSYSYINKMACMKGATDSRQFNFLVRSFLAFFSVALSFSISACASRRFLSLTILLLARSPYCTLLNIGFAHKNAIILWSPCPRSGRRGQPIRFASSSYSRRLSFSTCPTRMHTLSRRYLRYCCA